MTITLDATTERDLTSLDTRFLPDCPPWCIGAPDWHDPNYIVLHASAHHCEEVEMSGSAWDVDGGRDEEVATCGRAYLTTDRRQGPTVQIILDGAPRSATGRGRMLAVATLDETEQFAQHLLALVALGREGGQ